MALCGRTKLATILSLIAVLIVANPRLGAVDTVSSNTQQALDAIAVSALVLDRNGLPVRNVQATDLMVREDGRPVSLTSFNVTRTVDAAATRVRAPVAALGQGIECACSRERERLRHRSEGT
jgi:hypothetical protein